MASVSSSSSVGSTSLRGYGGLASGIDRDSIVEQMTLGTTTKIANQKKAIQKLEWKQEAFRSISDKLLNLQDNYFSYTASKNIKSASTFARNQISVLGDSNITKYITASGTSNMADYVSVKGVAQLATSSSQTSKSHGESENIETGDLNGTVSVSNLEGTQLEFCQYVEGTGLTNKVTFTFPSTYEEEGKTKNIDYTGDKAELVKQLNKALEDSSTKFGDNKIGDVFKFELNDEGKLQIVEADKKDALGNIEIDENGAAIKSDKFAHIFGNNGWVINASSSSLEALGYVKKDDVDTSKGLNIDAVNGSITKKFDDSCTEQSKMKYLADKKFSFTYNGETKTITLFTSEDVKNYESGSKSLDDLVKDIKNKLDKAFGSGKITVMKNGNGLSFGVTEKNKDKTLTISSSDSKALKEALGITKPSTKLSLTTSLEDNGLLNGKDWDVIKINGVELKDINKDSTINDLLNAINENSEIGVKATYLESKNQFVLISTETGEGRTITLDSEMAKTIFGSGSTKEVNGITVDYNFKDGQDAKVVVDYGDGNNVLVTSSSNTINVAGMKVTVSGIFGNVQENGSTITTDTSAKVTFKAKADVEGVTETVKKFIEEYNEMLSEIKTQITTKPDSDYGPLTDEQKEEMNETSIENWEKKAKEGLLYNNSTMRDLNSDLQNILTKLITTSDKGGSNISYADLEAIGITFSDDYSDGGKLVLDETKFKQAMESNPEKVSNIFCGGGDVKTGLAETIETTLTKYATRYASKNGNSYGRLIEEAGSSKVPLSVSNNEIYKQLKEMNEKLDELKQLLQTEQDRYISQFTTMETLINQYNSQSSYLTGMSS